MEGEAQVTCAEAVCGCAGVSAKTSNLTLPGLRISVLSMLSLDVKEPLAVSCAEPPAGAWLRRVWQVHLHILGMPRAVLVLSPAVENKCSMACCAFIVLRLAMLGHSDAFES